MTICPRYTKEAQRNAGAGSMDAEAQEGLPVCLLALDTGVYATRYDEAAHGPTRTDTAKVG